MRITGLPSLSNRLVLQLFSSHRLKNSTSILSRMSSSSQDHFPHSVDRFRCVKVDVKQLMTQQPDLNNDQFQAKLRESTEEWFKQNLRAIWFSVPLESAHLVPVLVKNDFKYHHAKPDYVTLVKWISKDEPYNIPCYPYTNIGVGGLVMDSKNRVLVVKEKYAHKGIQIWKYPGGYAYPGEDLGATAEREVLEETGIKASFKSIIAMRHLHKFQFDCSDIYVMCHLAIDDSDPKSLELTKCTHEIFDVKWIPVEELRQELSDFNRYVLDKYLESKEKGHSIASESVNFILGGTATVYSIHKNQQ